jgi:hypothetical protein
MSENREGVAVSAEKLEANRRNAQLSTGPKTEEGKSRSRGNALKHGILASAVLVTEGKGAESSAEFEELMEGLLRDRAPIGALEDVLVEKIAVCLWRQKRALRCEAGLIGRAFAPDRNEFEEDLAATFGNKPNLEREAIQDHLRVPLGNDLDRVLRYETTIQRHLTGALNQLERLQRARKGEHVPAPVSVQVSSDFQS